MIGGGICVFCTLLASSVPVLAGTTSRRANIKSTGNLNYEDGKVYFTASDLNYLADEIDNLECTYKIAVVDALNSIGTYFKRDGSTAFDDSQNETDTAEEKVALSFGKITEGIRNSQSIECLTMIQAIDKEGNLLFYTDEIAQTERDYQSITTIDTGLPVYYKAATTENLSAGTAAWVNGTLLQGNGADNSACYSQGWIDGQANITDNLNITYTYHYHEGDSINGGGCYEQVSSTKACGTIEYKRTYWREHTCHALCYSQYEDEYACKTCGAVTGSRCSGGGNSCGRVSGTISGTHYTTLKSWKPTCGYEDGQILTATIVY